MCLSSFLLILTVKNVRWRNNVKYSVFLILIRTPYSIVPHFQLLHRPMFSVFFSLAFSGPAWLLRCHPGLRPWFYSTRCKSNNCTGRPKTTNTTVKTEHTANAGDKRSRNLYQIGRHACKFLVQDDLWGLPVSGTSFIWASLACSSTWLWTGGVEKIEHDASDDQADAEHNETEAVDDCSCYHPLVRQLLVFLGLMT